MKNIKVTEEKQNKNTSSNSWQDDHIHDEQQKGDYNVTKNAKKNVSNRIEDFVDDESHSITKGNEDHAVRFNINKNRDEIDKMTRENQLR